MSNLTSLLNQFKLFLKSEIRTCTPARINSFNSTNLTVNVQPLIQGVRIAQQPNQGSVIQLENGERVLAENYDLPGLINVPISIAWFGVGGITMPILPDSIGLLLISDRDIRNFKKTYGISAQASLRTFDMNDSFFLPFLPAPASISDYSSDSIDVRYGATKLSVKEDGIVIEGTSQITGDMDITGNVNITGELIVNDIPFSTHIHPYTNTPPSVTEPPIA